MKTRVLLFAAIAATTFTFVACGNKQAKTNETAAVEQSGAMEIDSLLAFPIDLYELRWTKKG